MNGFRHLDRALAILKACHTCSQCTPICPSFQQSRRDAQSPRGRIVILRALYAGKISKEEAAQEIHNCLLCGKCSQACPAHLDLTTLFMAAKADLPAKENFWLNLFLHKILKHPRLFNLLWQNSLSLVKGQSKVFSKDSLKSLASFAKNRKKENSKIVIFAGCIANYVRPEILEACASIMNANNLDWISPDFACCGAYDAIHGRSGDARKLVRYNLKILKKLTPEKFLFLCPHCQKQFMEFLPSCGWLNKKEQSFLKDLAKISLGMEDLLADLGATITLPDKEKTVAFHKSCGAGNQKSLNCSRLFKKNGCQIITLKEQCCGNFLSGAHPLLKFFTPRRKKDTNQKNSSLKKGTISLAANLRGDCLSSGAKTVVTDCPGCKEILSNEFDCSFSNAKVLHWLELYADKLKK